MFKTAINKTSSKIVLGWGGSFQMSEGAAGHCHYIRIKFVGKILLET